jgi:hypothetical protein
MFGLPIRVWSYIGAALALTALLGYVHHRVYKEGWDDATAEVEKAAAKRQHELQIKINTAEHSHDDELRALRKFRDDYPVGPVRLCLGPRLSVETARSGQIIGRPGPAAEGVQPVPAGDPDGGARNAGPDIGAMLDALAARADEVNADRTALITIVEPLTK